MTKDKKRLDLVLMGTSMAIVGLIVLLLKVYPEQSTATANAIFAWLTKYFGLETDIWAVAITGILLYVAFSKYGQIRLGNSKPDYSTFSWVAMMMSAGLGAATLWWGFVEWGYYFGANPQFWGYEMSESMRYQLSLAYNQFHWGPTAWGIYAIFALPICYHFYIKKRAGLSMGAVVANVFDKENPDRIAHGWPGKLIDFLYIFGTIGACGITLGLSASMITEALARAVGMQATFTWNIVLILVIAVVYSFSSYIGIEKGMRFISDSNAYLIILFAAFVCITGPCLFIFKNIFNSLGVMFGNYIRMSTWTEPIASTGFVDGWTIFYWLYWIVFGPMMGIFIARVSKGRTLKEVVLNMMISGSIGIWLMHGILGSFTMFQDITGKVKAVELINNGNPNEAIVQTLMQLPMSSLLIGVFALSAILFLATTLDSASFTLSAVVTKGIKEGEDPSPMLRLVWCVILSLVPLTMIFIGAPLNTFKTLAIAIAVPCLIVVCIMIYGWLKDMMTDYGNKSVNEIAAEFKLNEVKTEAVAEAKVSA